MLFPLVMELKNKLTGEIHFRRWRIFSTANNNLYLHNIRQSDQDKFPHNHPWNFSTFILWGGYKEYSNNQITFTKMGSLLTRFCDMFHKIELTNGPTWSLVFTWGGHKPWGYMTDAGYVDSEKYRMLKKEGAFK